MQGWVYVIEALGQGLFKIGMTTGEPSDRLKQLQTGNPFKLDLLIAFSCPRASEMEKEVLGMFRKEATPMVGEWIKVNREEVLDGMMHFFAGILKQFGISDFRSTSIKNVDDNPERFR